MRKVATTPDAEHRSLASGLAGGLEHTYLVEAGAGTGKTTVLVDRMLALLAAGTRISRIVAITFTEKAAAELKVRLRGSLEKRVRDALSSAGKRGSGDRQAAGSDRASIGVRDVADAETLERLTTALHEIDRAQVSTIHGFCSNLLKERPVEAGVDPGFSVADELRRTLILDTVWDAWIREQFSKELPPAVAEAQSLGHGLSRIQELALHMIQNRDLLNFVPGPVAPPDLDSLMSDLRAAAGSFDELATTACTDPEDKALPAIHNFVTQVDIAENLPDDMRASYVMRYVTPAPGRGKGRKTNWAGDTLEEMRAEAEGLKERLEEAGRVLAHNATVELVQWLRGFVSAYDREKASLGVLDFQDLLEKARDLVRDNIEVREHFKRAFDRILLDEFQDTDPLQCELAFFLCERKGGAAHEWSQVDLEPGKLFLVGDPKQSIYRFRRADIETYEEAKSVIARSGSVLELTENFRTRPQITDGVNSVFAVVMRPPEDGRMYQPDYAPLSAFRAREPEGPGIVLLHPGSDPGDRADDIRNAEARTVAAFISRSRERGDLRVLDKDTKLWRPAELRDMAILFHATTALDAYEEALSDYGIDYRIAGGKKFYARREVKELATVLAAIEDPHDLSSVVGALRTPFMGASDEEILLYRYAAGTLNYLEDADPGIPAVQEAFALLRELHRERSSLGPTRLMRKLFDSTNALELFLLKPSGEQRHANLMKVVELADGLEKTGSLSFGGFVRWLADVQQLTPEEAESPMSEEGDDFVRVLTIHKAKGLEFPVTVLADLGRRKVYSERVVVDRLSDRLEFGLGAEGDRLATLGYDDLSELEKRRQDAELMRLLYVGMTRARDVLVIPWFEGGNQAGKNLFFPMLAPLAEAAGDAVGDLADERAAPGPVAFDAAALDITRSRTRPTRLDTEAAAAAEPAETEAARALKAWRVWLSGFRARHDHPRAVVTPSATEAHRAADEASSEDRQPAIGVSRGADVGTVVHRAMEQIDLADPSEAHELARSAAGSAGMTEDVAQEAADVIARGLGSDIIRRAREACRLWREVPFNVATEAGSIEGVMDMVFEEDDGLVIVDYKTDRIGKGGTSELAGRYRGQAEAYAAALTVAANRPVKEVVLLFMRGPREESVTAPGTRADAESMLADLLTFAADRGS